MAIRKGWTINDWYKDYVDVYYNSEVGDDEIEKSMH